MVTDNQVRRLLKLMQTEETFGTAAAKAGMDDKTARKYARSGKLPSDMRKEHTWRTREDPFARVWEEVRMKLAINPGLEAKTLFDYLQRKYPGEFSDGQLRTLQRRVKTWRALEGPPKEVFFPQEYSPGQLSQSDFTYMNKLGIRVGGRRFNHLIYHFVLPYSNWETGTVCYSESFESLSEGFQNALWELGGVPREHQTDRFKKAVEQSLLLRGSHDFENREAYEQFLRTLFTQLNAGRRKRFEEELKVLRRLPSARLNTCKRLRLKVGPSSTIRVNHNVYSVDSRLIGEYIHVRLHAAHLEVWYGQRCIEKIPRLRGEGNHRIQYRHIIDWLVRKPGAFEHYRYREDLFPTHRFRIAYDALKRKNPSRAGKEYVKILYLAARENEAATDGALRQLIEEEQTISYDAVEEILRSGSAHDETLREVVIEPVDVRVYDELLSGKVVV